MPRRAALLAAGQRYRAAAGGGPVVNLSPGANVQSAIDANPNGTTFNFAAGTYTNINNLAPKDGNVFDGGNRAAIFDAQNVYSRAFRSGLGASTTANNVTIRGFVMQNYDTALQDGVIQSFGTTGWTIENNHITFNAATAVATDTGAHVLNNLFDWNRQAGYAAHGSDILYEGNEIAFNNHDLVVDATWEAGGGKAWGTVNAVFRNNYVHDNGGNGLWDDTNNIYILYDGNISDNNWGAGIYHEIGYEATFINNVLRWNGMPSSPAGGQNLGWMWDGGIQIRSSRPVDPANPIVIQNNVVIDNCNGIALLDSPYPATTGPPEAAYGELYLGGIHVQNNYISQTKGATGAVQDARGTVVFTGSDITWTGNKYQTPGAHAPAEIGNWHAWMNGERSFSEWQSFGLDTTGSETSGIAIDSSTPARVTKPGNGGAVSTTASFDPPPNSLLLFCGSGDGTGQFFSVSNNGVPLTWTEIALRNIDDAGGLQGNVHTFYAQVTAARTGMTVTATYTEANDTSFKLYVITGADSFDPIGGVAEGSSTSTTTSTTAYTSQVAGGLSFLTTADYNVGGTPTSSDTTLDADTIPTQLSFASGYKAIATAGASITHNVQVPAAPLLNWVTFEVRKAVAI